MKTQSALQLFQYWNRLRNGAPAPSRTQIEPSDIRDVLSHTFILETKKQSDEVSFRLAGTAIGNLFGRPLRSSPLRDLFQNAHRPVISRLVRNCYQDKVVVLLGLDAVSRTGRQSILELLMLPLQDESEGHRVLGCVVPLQYQFWHGLEPVTEIDLHSIRTIDPEREPLFLANRPEIAVTPALAPGEDQIGFGQGVRKGIQLLVIPGGKQGKTSRP